MVSNEIDVKTRRCVDQVELAPRGWKVAEVSEYTNNTNQTHGK